MITGNENGYLCLVLHAHLPFIRHPEYDDFLEEDWFFEAVIETYLPLLVVFEKLLEENIDFRLTISLTPPLCAMFSDDLLKQRCRRHLHKLIELTEKELLRTRHQPEFHRVVQMYETKLKKYRYYYEDYYHSDLISAFKKFQDLGKIEIITCGATHNFLPLNVNRQAVRAQIKIAADDYSRLFGRRPRGIWLAECAYNPGDDQILKDEGLRFFFLEAHGLLFGVPRPRYGVFAPVYCPSGVAAFSRDIESAVQVWSAQLGYPGDYRYREFYRDIGYDAEDDNYIRPYLHSDGVRRNVGLKYHRITGKVDLHSKQPYNPDEAREAAASHAGNFMYNREKQAEYLSGLIGRKPLIVSMYDAELFGHWWYEGPDFLDFLFRKIHYDQKNISLITPIEYLNMYPNNQVLQPSMSSWGDKGYNEVWLNGTNDWIYPHLHKMSERMIELASENPLAEGIRKEALNQAARELLLAQSSDWAFLMTVGTALNYAQKRTKDHLNRFLAIYEQIKRDQIDADYINNLKSRDNIFPNLDYRAYIPENSSLKALTTA
ncbi:MAG: 1,4-alpha-glucan branching protein domain-containing protein [Elusimicrobiota bacterium]